MATTLVALPESTPAGISSSISASALSELNQLPTIVAEPDTPSAAVQSPLVPSETQLASGNLDGGSGCSASGAGRRAPLQRERQRRDATTVLIRVRARLLLRRPDPRAPQRLLGAGPHLRADSRNPAWHPALVATDLYSEGEGRCRL